MVVGCRGHLPLRRLCNRPRHAGEPASNAAVSVRARCELHWKRRCWRFGCGSAPSSIVQTHLTACAHGWATQKKGAWRPRVWGFRGTFRHGKCAWRAHTRRGARSWHQRSTQALNSRTPEPHTLCCPTSPSHPQQQHYGHYARQCSHVRPHGSVPPSAGRCAAAPLRRCLRSPIQDQPRAGQQVAAPSGAGPSGLGRLVEGGGWWTDDGRGPGRAAGLGLGFEAALANGGVSLGGAQLVGAM